MAVQGPVSKPEKDGPRPTAGQAAMTRRTLRRDERVTVRRPVREPEKDVMARKGGAASCRVPCAVRGGTWGALCGVPVAGVYAVRGWSAAPDRPQMHGLRGAACTGTTHLSAGDVTTDPLTGGCKVLDDHHRIQRGCGRQCHIDGYATTPPLPLHPADIRRKEATTQEPRAACPPPPPPNELITYIIIIVYYYYYYY